MSFVKKIIKKYIPKQIWQPLRFFIWLAIWRIKFIIFRKYKTNDPYPTNGVIWVDPGSIFYESNIFFKPYADRNKIIGGNWDLTYWRVEDSAIAKALFDVFKYHKRWSDTEYYNTALKRISEGKPFLRMGSREELDSRGKEIEALYHSLITNGIKVPNKFSEFVDNETEVNINRKGQLIVQSGIHRFVLARLLGIKKFPIKIIVRHSEWVDFKKEIHACLATNHGKSYAPLTHPDLELVPSAHSESRFSLIMENLTSKTGKMLDIGSNWGYFCHKFEEAGFESYAIEEDTRNAYFIKKLKEAENRKFEVFGESIFSFYKKHKIHFNVTLALAIFHHFLKNKEIYQKFLEFLSFLDTDELFFEAERPEKMKKMEHFMDLMPEEFVKVILKHSNLTNVKFIGNSDAGRPIYRIWR
jgi:hypothetical protein